ncbi:hypothetical protein ACFFX0_18375 [Citricoccus parietis]|uniref:Uncharacterized protein n=1 Tax=Citricoccus parietis TaxID=592307 RepID=A0ABV5G3L8_9MICC
MPSWLRSHSGSRPRSAANGSLTTSRRGSGASSACQGTHSSGRSEAKFACRDRVGWGIRLTLSTVSVRRGRERGAIVVDFV